MLDIRILYKDFCKVKGIQFIEGLTVKSPDESTIFCTSGMQKYKKLFEDSFYQNTVADIQPCIRGNDLDDITDGTHFAYFNMIGMFSFRQLTMPVVVELWIEFLQEWLDLKIEYVTIHPDKDGWRNFYCMHPKIEIRHDEECIWSDGNITGYCTEFYIDGVEVGNIVNPLGTCIDVGFGLERLELMLGKKFDTIENIKNTILEIEKTGIKPSPNNQGYVLRKLLRMLSRQNVEWNHPSYLDEVKRQNKIRDKYERNKIKHGDKSPEWWFDTFGVVLSEMTDE